MKIVVVLLVACAALRVETKPLGEYDDVDNFFPFRSDNVLREINQCHGITCPEHTTSCSKTTKTSDDKKLLLTIIRCEDVNGNVLDSATEETSNPDANTQITRFSFIGHYSFGNVNNRPTYTNTVDVDRFNKNDNRNNYDAVERFD